MYTAANISLGLLFLMEERLPTPSEGRLSARGRFLLSISPVVAVFLVAEWLSITGAGSFAGLLGYVGVISLPLLGGIFPVLLLAASRRKGDFVPGLGLRLLGNPVVLMGTYLLFLDSIFVYGLFIYEGAVERVVTLLVGSVVLVVSVIMLRRGALDTRVVVELRQDLTPDGQHVFNITANGQPTMTEVWLGYGDSEQHVQAATGEVTDFASLRHATFQLPATGAQELSVGAPDHARGELSKPARAAGSALRRRKEGIRPQAVRRAGRAAAR